MLSEPPARSTWPRWPATARPLSASASASSSGREGSASRLPWWSSERHRLGSVPRTLPRKTLGPHTHRLAATSRPRRTTMKQQLVYGCWPRLQNAVDDLQADMSHASPFVPSPRMCFFLVIAEDRRFPYHPGFDPLALCRAAWRTSFGGPRQGGSTIAMQLVRTVVDRRELTLRRKAVEVALAARLTRYMPVESIPALYLWTAYYGWNMEGFRQACEALRVDPRSSTPAQDAGLVARLKYPQPKSDDAMQLARIRTRVAHITRLARQRTLPDAGKKYDALYSTTIDGHLHESASVGPRCPNNGL